MKLNLPEMQEMKRSLHLNFVVTDVVAAIDVSDQCPNRYFQDIIFALDMNRVHSVDVTYQMEKNYFLLDFEMLSAEIVLDVQSKSFDLLIKCLKFNIEYLI